MHRLKLPCCVAGIPQYDVLRSRRKGSTQSLEIRDHAHEVSVVGWSGKQRQWLSPSAPISGCCLGCLVGTVVVSVGDDDRKCIEEVEGIAGPKLIDCPIATRKDRVRIGTRGVVNGDVLWTPNGYEGICQGSYRPSPLYRHVRRQLADAVAGITRGPRLLRGEPRKKGSREEKWDNAMGVAHDIDFKKAPRGLTPSLHLRATNVRVRDWTASFKNTAPDRCKRWLGSTSY